MFSSCDTLPNTFTGTTSAPLKVGPQDGMDIMAIKKHRKEERGEGPS